MKRYYLIIPASLLIVIVAFIFLPANKPKPTLLSPAIPLQVQPTPEEKQEILDTVKLALESISKGIAIYPNDDRAFAQATPLGPKTEPVGIEDLPRLPLTVRLIPRYTQLTQVYNSR